MKTITRRFGGHQEFVRQSGPSFDREMQTRAEAIERANPVQSHRPARLGPCLTDGLAIEDNIAKWSQRATDNSVRSVDATRARK